MGLDMYLYKTTYYFDSSDAKRPLPEGIQPERLREIKEQVGYWRKANAIHGWFVKHCQGGVDECQETEIERGQLKELLKSDRAWLVTERMKWE